MIDRMLIDINSIMDDGFDSIIISAIDAEEVKEVDAKLHDHQVNITFNLDNREATEIVIN